MEYNFAVSESQLKNYEHTKKLNSEYSFYYNSKDYFISVSKNGTELICYGYCFDVRDPNTDVKETLLSILSKGSFYNELNYLNGQYILVLIDEDNICITIDSTSLIPIYYSKEEQLISNNLGNYRFEGSSAKIMNPALILELNNFHFSRNEIKSIPLDNKQIEEEILKLVENQHLYFRDKKFIVQFRSNNYIKALLAIIQPVLYNNYLCILSNDINSKNRKYGQLIANEYRMNFLETETENLKGDINGYEKSTTNYIAKNNLFTYKSFSEYNKELGSVIREKYESNIAKRKRAQSIELAKIGLLYDPFNVRLIQYYLYNHNKKTGFNPIGYITKTLHPSLNYYDFASDGTLSEVNKSLNYQIEKLKEDRITSKNQKFLIETKTTDFRVSDNLDGKIKENEILVYPALQKIKKDEEYNISYKNPGEGLVYIESFCDNKNDCKSIKVDINGEIYNIDEFLEGVLINIESVLKVTVKYEKDVNSLKWQKAGTILIRKK